MSDKEYLMYQGNGGLGNVGLSLQVFGLITQITSQETKDVVLDLPQHGLFSFGKGPIICHLNQDSLDITIEIRIRYGKNVNKTSRNLQNRIADAIKNMTDVSVHSVNVQVVGVAF